MLFVAEPNFIGIDPILDILILDLTSLKAREFLTIYSGEFMWICCVNIPLFHLTSFCPPLQLLSLLLHHLFLLFNHELFLFNGFVLGIEENGFNIADLHQQEYQTFVIVVSVLVPLQEQSHHLITNELSHLNMLQMDEVPD